MISGNATPEGTEKFAKNSGVNPGNFKTFENLFLSNVGIGTYLGDADARTDELVTNAVKQSIQSGVNVIDTAMYIFPKTQLNICIICNIAIFRTNK